MNTLKIPTRVKRYHRTGRILSVAGYLVDLALLLILLFTGWTVALRTLALHYSPRPWLALLIYLGLFGIITQVASLPFDFLRGFWLEHRYGLSNLTLAGWVKDQLKGLAVGGTLAVLAVEFLYAAMRRWPERWWILCAIVFIGFFVLLANLAPVLIFPIFFKVKPLENPSLTERLLELSRRAGTRVKGVFEWKLSEKSKKANAALMGLGNTRRIILSDTLLEKFQDEEVEAVLAHELGHHVHRHIFQSIALQGAATFVGFYLIHRTLDLAGPAFRISRRRGFRQPSASRAGHHGSFPRPSAGGELILARHGAPGGYLRPRRHPLPRPLHLQHGKAGGTQPRGTPAPPLD